MSNNVEDRIVSMKFENSKFQSGVQATLGILDKLKKALNFQGASKGMEQVQQAANKFDGGHMSKAVDAVSARFSAMRVVAYTAIANITNRFVNMGVNFAKALTIDPIKAGFQNYQQQINALQVIGNNVSAEFKNNLAATNAAVTKQLAALNVYANQTIFDFKDMASATGQFTAAGLKLKDATATVVGVANASALAGASTQQFAMVLPQLGQALARGKVQAQDWMSVTNDGLDSFKLKQTILTTAEAVGTLKVKQGETIDVAKDFRKVMETGAITSDVLRKSFEALGVAKGRDTEKTVEAKLATMGYSKAQAELLAPIALQAYHSAANVRTLTALTENLKQTLSSNTATFFKGLIGDLPTATNLFTSISNDVNDIFNRSADNQAKFVKAFQQTGGQKALLATIHTGLSDIAQLIVVIENAWHRVIPAFTGGGLTDGLKRINLLLREFGSYITSAHGIATISGIVKGIAAAFDIMHQITKGAIAGVITFFEAITGKSSSGGGLGEFAKGLGNALASFDAFLKKTGVITAVFQTLGQILAVPIRLLIDLGSAVGGLFGGFQSGGGGTNLTTTFDGINHSTQSLSDSINNLMARIQPFIARIKSFFSELGKGIGQAFSSGNFNGVTRVLETGLFAGIFLTLRKFLKNFQVILFSGEGFIKPIRETFETLTGSLKTMQLQLKAKVLEELAIAIGVLTASVVILSTINPGKLGKAMAAIAVGLSELMGSMIIISKAVGLKGLAIIPVFSASMIALSAALIVFSGAVAIMGLLKPKTLAQGLAGIAASLTLMTGVALTLAGAESGIIAGAFAMQLLSTAMIALAAALKIMGSIKWPELQRGITALGASLAIMVIALQSAIDIVPEAGALLILSAALIAISAALKIMGTLDFKTIGRAMTALGGSLAIMVAALSAVIDIVPEAAGLLILSAALIAMGVALKLLATLSLKDIAVSLTALAGALAIMVAAGFAAEAASVGLLALSGAMLAFGAAIALIGVGIGVAALGIAALAAAWTAGSAAIGAAVTFLISKIPSFIEAFAKGIVGMIKTLIDAIPQFVDGIAKIIEALLNTIIKLAPKFGQTAIVLVHTLLKVLRSTIPDIVNTGIFLIISLLNGIANNANKLVDSAFRAAKAIIHALVTQLGKAAGELGGAAWNIIQKLWNGLWDAVNALLDDLLSLGKWIGSTIARGITDALKATFNGVKKGGNWLLDNLSPGGIVNQLTDLYHSIPFMGGGTPYKAAFNAGSTIMGGLITGMDNELETIQDRATLFAKTMNESLSNAFTDQSIGPITPVIKPVLDLTDVSNKASTVSSLFGKTTLGTKVSLTQAQVASQSLKDVGGTQVNPTVIKQDIKFEQTNNSPKALSAIEIYRNTNSQLALAKEALKTA